MRIRVELELESRSGDMDAHYSLQSYYLGITSSAISKHVTHPKVSMIPLLNLPSVMMFSRLLASKVAARLAPHKPECEFSLN